MRFISARATRTTVTVVALSAAGLWALRVMDAKADPPSSEESQPCVEGRALFAAKLAYLEARVSPQPSQVEAWRAFANAMRASTGELDRACAEEPPGHLSVDAGERMERMEKHAAAMQAMFGEMAKAYVAVAPSLTAEQRDILSRNIVPSHAAREFFSAQRGGRWAPPRQKEAANCGHGGPERDHPAPPPL
jgi:hypothetical protein